MRYQVATSACKQKVQAEVKDANSNVQSSASFDGVQKESLYLEDDSTKKTIIWGPFDAETSVELSFSHQDSDTDDWEPSSVKSDKIKEASSILLSCRSTSMTGHSSILPMIFKQRFHWYALTVLL